MNVKTYKGFSLIELMIVISIVGISAVLHWALVIRTADMDVTSEAFDTCTTFIKLIEYENAQFAFSPLINLNE